MAYAERRGRGRQPWRVKYKLPSGTEASESGFETKAAALAWGRDQEARIREGRWTDPSAGKITVGDWIGRWLTIQDVGISTADNRDYLIRRFIRPAWGDSALNSLSTEEITRWENTLPARVGISRRTARDARSLLCTILGDAAATKPPLIPYNPALRPRNRGRRTGRRLDRGPQRAWATPLEALLLAERAALLSGRDDDFTLLITIGYTGLRWGEAIGLEHGYVTESEIHVEWQLREVNGVFHRLPPKDDSYRSPAWEPCLPVDLPGFLSDLLTRQTQGRAGGVRVPASMAAPAGMCFSAPTAATTAAATTPAGCSAPPATGGTNRDPAARPGWSSPTPPSGQASRSPCGHPPSRAPTRTSATRHPEAAGSGRFRGTRR